VNGLFGSWSWYVAAAVVFVAAWGLNRLLRARADRPIENPKNLFRDLCWAHDLTRGEVSLLKSLAKHWKLATPTRLFVQPSHFDLATLGASWEPQAGRIVELRDRLFLSGFEEAATRA
jgi:hypothetical protein